MLIAVMAAFSLTEGRRANKCTNQRIKRYVNKCLKNGHQSTLGCESKSGKSKLTKLQAKRCAKLEKILKQCDSPCKPQTKPKPKPKPEPETKPKPKPKPEPETKPKPKPKPEPKPKVDPSDWSCAMGGNFFGKDIKDIPSDGYESCSIACADTAGCKSFSLRKTDNRCFLKNMYGGAVPQPISNMISRNMQCDTSPIDFSCARKNTKFSGYGSHYGPASIEGCARACRMTENCKSIQVAHSKGNYCRFFFKVGGDLGAIPTNEAYTSMVVDCSAETKSMVDIDVNPSLWDCSLNRWNFPGEDIKDIPFTESTAGEECSKACLETAGCKSFSLRLSDSRCFLKKTYGGVFPVRDLAWSSRNIKCDRSLLDVSCARKSTMLKGSSYYSGETKEGFRECAMLCRLHERCKSFYHDDGINKCWYFDKLGGDEGPVPASSRYTSMVKDCRAVY